jgi:hypothetical protein
MGTYNFNVDNFCRQILKIYGNSSVMLEGWPLLEFCMIEILENQGSLSLSLSLSNTHTHASKGGIHLSPLSFLLFLFPWTSFMCFQRYIRYWPLQLLWKVHFGNSVECSISKILVKTWIVCASCSIEL